jgi:hypothetical protein
MVFWGPGMGFVRATVPVFALYPAATEMARKVEPRLRTVALISSLCQTFLGRFMITPNCTGFRPGIFWKREVS